MSFRNYELRVNFWGNAPFNPRRNYHEEHACSHLPRTCRRCRLSCRGDQESAAEIKKPVTEWTCEEFISLSDQYKPNAVYWASAYVKGGKPEASELDIAATEQITPGIVQDCEREPKSSFWQKLKSTWEKVEAEAKKMEKKM